MKKIYKDLSKLMIITFLFFILPVQGIVFSVEGTSGAGNSVTQSVYGMSTPTPTPTSTSTATPTSLVTPTPIATPTPLVTSAPTPTPTVTPTPSSTPTPTPSATPTPSVTPTPTASASPTPTPDTLNIAAGKTLTSKSALKDETLAVDNSIESGFTSLDSGIQWLQVDLGGSYDINKIRLWHYYADGRKYKDVIVQISNDPDFIFSCKTVFNNDRNNSCGQGIGTDTEYEETADGKEITFIPKKGRYVRFWSNGSNMNEWNHYAEVQVYGIPYYSPDVDLDNLALNKSVTFSGTYSNPSYATDGNTSTDNYTGLTDGLQWIQVDLQKQENLKRLKVWHYFGDGRAYKDVVVQLSNDPEFKTDVKTIFNNDTDNSTGLGAGKNKEYYESKEGKTIDFGTITARYLRLWSNGSNVNAWNHYVDIQAFAKGKKAVNSQIPVLMYHSIVEKSSNIYEVSTSDFDAQMKYLKDNGFKAISMADYISIMHGEKTRPSKAVLITFNDGWLDNYTVAVPILKKYRMTATFFIVSNFIGNGDRTLNGMTSGAGGLLMGKYMHPSECRSFLTTRNIAPLNKNSIFL